MGWIGLIVGMGLMGAIGLMAMPAAGCGPVASPTPRPDGGAPGAALFQVFLPVAPEGLTWQRQFVPVAVGEPCATD